VNKLALLLLLGAAGCLQPGAGPYGKLDETAPTLRRINPAMGGDAGVVRLLPQQFIELTFSEQMDLDSLRPGIVVRNTARREQLIEVSVEPTTYAPDTPADLDVEMTVRVVSAQPDGFASGGYQLILRTLLLDRQGNPFEREFLGAFTVN
jgi:hypothetical protein